MDLKEKETLVRKNKKLKLSIVIIVLVSMCLFGGLFYYEEFINKKATKKNNIDVSNKIKEDIKKQSDSLKSNENDEEMVASWNFYSTHVSDYYEAINEDYDDSECGAEYYAKKFFVEDGLLYSEIDKNNSHTNDIKDMNYKIADDIVNVFIISEGQCGYTRVYASTKDGDLYSFNNIYSDSNEYGLRFEKKLIKKKAYATNVISIALTDGVGGSVQGYYVDINSNVYAINE